MADTWWVNPEQLDDEQKEVVKLPGDGSYLILGPPGSGKTNLLLLRANYLSLKGKPNLVILTFTRNLKEFISLGGAQYAFPTSKINTHISWSKDFLRMYGVTPEEGRDLLDFRRNLCRQIRELITANGLKNIYDAILLDEAQDYLPDEILIFKDLSSSLFAVADSHQRIYPLDSPIEVIQNNVDDTLSLTFHYRNGRKICRLAEEILQSPVNGQKNFMSIFSQYDEISRPSNVEKIRALILRTFVRGY